MQYVLGNMLNGGGGLNPDGLALDLQFAADKTLTARKGPTPVFTRGSTGTFVGSDGLVQSAAVNTPRFDHDPVTLASRGLLIEESRTNLILQSDNFASASWTKNASSISSNVEPAPDDSVSADKLITDNGVTLGRAAQTFTLTGSHVYSVFAKASEWGWISIFPLGAIGGVWFDLVNGVVGTQQSGRVGSITSFGNGWYRCAVQCTGIGTSNTTARIISTNADGVQSTGDGTSGIFIWGAQLEAGSFPTSYIPTVASSVVRSADVCSITSSTLWNASEGTLLSKTIIPTGGFDCYPANWQNFFGHRRTSSNTLSAIIRGGGTFDLSLGTFVSGSLRVACTHGGNLVSAVANGGSISSTSGTLVLNSTVLGIGYSGSGAPINGPVDSIRYYRKRLPNAKLQAITA